VFTLICNYNIRCFKGSSFATFEIFWSELGLICIKSPKICGLSTSAQKLRSHNLYSPKNESNNLNRYTLMCYHSDALKHKFCNFKDTTITTKSSLLKIICSEHNSFCLMIYLCQNNHVRGTNLVHGFLTQTDNNRYITSLFHPVESLINT
jgi:hypothetical protein